MHDIAFEKKTNSDAKSAPQSVSINDRNREGVGERSDVTTYCRLEHESMLFAVKTLPKWPPFSSFQGLPPSQGDINHSEFMENKVFLFLWCPTKEWWKIVQGALTQQRDIECVQTSVQRGLHQVRRKLLSPVHLAAQPGHYVAQDHPSDAGHFCSLLRGTPYGSKGRGRNLTPTRTGDKILSTFLHLDSQRVGSRWSTPHRTYPDDPAVPNPFAKTPRKTKRDFTA